MKKRVISLIVAVLVIFSAVGCMDNADSTYTFSKANVTEAFVEEDSIIAATFESRYEGTKLKIFDDGSWIIDGTVGFVSNAKIDMGTYTVDGDIYIFEGFEFEMDVYGTAVDGGFKIEFYIPKQASDDLAAELYYEA